MPTGIEMLLKASGMDLGKMTADFEQLKEGVKATLRSIDERLERIEKAEGKVSQLLTDTVSLLKETNPVLLADLEQIRKLSEELTAWKRQQVTAQLHRLNQQQPPNQSQSEPPLTPAEPPSQQQQQPQSLIE